MIFDDLYKYCKTLSWQKISSYFCIVIIVIIVLKCRYLKFNIACILNDIIYYLWINVTYIHLDNCKRKLNSIQVIKFDTTVNWTSFINWRLITPIEEQLAMSIMCPMFLFGFWMYVVINLGKQHLYTTQVSNILWDFQTCWMDGVLQYIYVMTRLDSHDESLLV